MENEEKMRDGDITRERWNESAGVKNTQHERSADRELKKKKSRKSDRG